MTFKELQKNHPVYLLDKSKVEVKQGKVVEVTPHMNTGMTTIPSGTQPMRDVTIEVEGKPSAYIIPEQLSVTFAGDLVISTTKEGLSPEVERMKNEADTILASVDRMKEVKERSEELLATLNPAVKEKQETERRFKSIEGDISGIKGMVKQLLDKLG